VCGSDSLATGGLRQHCVQRNMARDYLFVWASVILHVKILEMRRQNRILKTKKPQGSKEKDKKVV
jgi:uncharacterized protein (UPF0548 family)